MNLKQRHTSLQAGPVTTTALVVPGGSKSRGLHRFAVQSAGASIVNPPEFFLEKFVLCTAGKTTYVERR